MVENHSDEVQHSHSDDALESYPSRLDETSKAMAASSPPTGPIPATASTIRPPSRRRLWFLFVAGCILSGLLVLNKDVQRLPVVEFSSKVAKVKSSEAMSKDLTHRESQLEEHEPPHGDDFSHAVPRIPLHAADALQCRESVVSFVIYATDVKDECEGLKKAFDKTCGNAEQESADDRTFSTAATTTAGSDTIASRVLVP